MVHIDSQPLPRQVWLDRYTKRTTRLLSALALVYLVTFSIQSIWPDPGAPWYFWLQVFANLLWLLFAIDLLFRFIMSTTKRHFFRKNFLDTITVVIPQLRALRALRAFTSGGVLSKKGLLSGGAITTAALAVLLVVWVGALMVLNAERDAPGAEITTLAIAIWWAFETITTVGYGDFVPITGVGRSFAVLVMFAGITVLGVVSATLAATLVKKGASSAAPADSPSTQVLDELAQLRAMVARLEDRLSWIEPPTTGSARNPGPASPSQS
jgi:voltage-gated potassium channel